MRKVQKQWPDIAGELSDQLRNCKLSNNELSIASGVNYFAIRRFRKDGVWNKTSGAIMLCTFFKISEFKYKKVQNTELDKLISELISVWDGSESHAQLLTKLIQSTKSFKVEGRCR